MANALKDLSDGDITREALAVFHNELKFLKTVNNQYDDRFQREGAKNGGSLLIRNPNEYTVRSGKVRNANDYSESTQTLTVATQRGVDLPSVSSLDQMMSIQDFRERFLKPAMLRLAAEVENVIISDAYKYVFNYTGTPATTPASLLAVRNAGARLSQNLAPMGDRSLLMDASAMAATTDAMNAYFHKKGELEKSFTKGFIGHAAGFDWYESEMVPTHTNGSRDDTTPVCNTSTGITSGSEDIVTTGADGTWKEGDVFTIADVYAVNRETKTRQDHLQQFVVRADNTNDATDTIKVLPVPVTSGAKQNVELVSAGAGKAIVNVAAGGSGTADAVYAQPLAYHRDFLTFVTADMHIEPGQRMSREVIDGISMRVWHGADFNNDDFGTRVDVIFGWLVQRPEWCVRFRG